MEVRMRNESLERRIRQWKKQKEENRFKEISRFNSLDGGGERKTYLSLKPVI